MAKLAVGSQVLVLLRRKMSDSERAAAYGAVVALRRAKLVPTRSDELDWQALAQSERTFEGQCNQAARKFAGFVLVEGRDDTGYFLAKGQYATAKAALARKKPVRAYRDGKLVPVCRVVLLNQKNWKGAYATAVVE